MGIYNVSHNFRYQGSLIFSVRKFLKLTRSLVSLAKWRPHSFHDGSPKTKLWMLSQWKTFGSGRGNLRKGITEVDTEKSGGVQEDLPMCATKTGMVHTAGQRRRGWRDPAGRH